MPLRFNVLASGSLGNCAILRAGGAGAGLLIDLGLGPRALAARLAVAGLDWSRVGAALLTHTHGDHLNPNLLPALAKHRVPLLVHAEHLPQLPETADELQTLGLLRVYDDAPFLTPNGHRVEPVRMSHDAGATFGFRIEAKSRARERAAAVGFVTDTGSWTPGMVEAFADVDLMAVEFNHDVELQRNSGRPWPLIQRVLGDRGHLSNDQGAELLAAVAARSHAGAPRRVVLLHLSQQCNTEQLARDAARDALRRAGRSRIPGDAIHVARQNTPSPDLWVHPAKPRARRRAPIPVSVPVEVGSGASAAAIDLSDVPF